jgi:hypothetical protein
MQHNESTVIATDPSCRVVYPLWTGTHLRRLFL